MYRDNEEEDSDNAQGGEEDEEDDEEDEFLDEDAIIGFQSKRRLTREERLEVC